MEGRETGQNLHSRSFYDVMNPHGHSSPSLHASSLSHEGLQYPMHAPHAIQQMYPFGGRWSGFSPGNSGSSPEISSSAVGSTQSGSTKHISTSHSFSTAASTGTSQSWWGSPPVYPGISNSDLLPFSSMPWSTHEHHEPLSSSRESIGSSFHGSHMRMSNGLLASSGHSHGYHRPHGSQFQSGGTLIHFPHTSSHQPASAKEEQPWVSSSGDPMSHTSSSSVVSEFSQYHKGKPKKIVKDDPLLSAATEAREKVQSRNPLPGNSTGVFKDKDLLDDINLYHIDEDISALEDSERAKHNQKVQVCEKGNGSTSGTNKKEKASFGLELTQDRANHNLHSVPHMMPDWKAKHDRMLVQDSHGTKYSRPLHLTAAEHPKVNSPKASGLHEDSHTTRSYPAQEKIYPSYSFSASSELDKIQHIPGIVSHKSYLQGEDVQRSKHDAHHIHASEGASPPHRQGTPSNLHIDRMARAQATQDWVNQHPALHASSPDHSAKQDQQGKYPDSEAKFNSQFDKRLAYLPSSAKSPGLRIVGRAEKQAKREQHYESPLNSSLPRYSASSKYSKPSSPKVTSKSSDSNLVPSRYHQNKHPFNVDFLSVSADSEKKTAHEAEDQRQSYATEYIKPSDRVSVIQTMPTIPGLNKDIPDSLLGDQARHQVPSPRRDMFDVARHKKPSSLLDTPLPSKKQTEAFPREGLPQGQEEVSSQNSESGSSSSGEDSGDEDDEEDEEDGMVIDVPDLDSKTNENGTENEEDESEDGSEEASGNGSDAEDSSDSGSDSESDENESQSQSTQDENASLPESSPEKRKADFDKGKEPKRRKIVDENLIRIPMESGWKRQTRIRPTGNGDGLRGDVYYFAPCGKKIRTYPEVTKYFEKNGISNLGLENFSFSTKTTVGEFLEAKQGSKFEVLSEEEVLRRHNLDKERQIERFEKMSKKRERKKLKAATVKRTQQSKTRKKVERQAVMEEAKLTKRRSLKAMADQKRRNKESEKQHRELERLQKQEQIRVEKEMRARSIQQEKIHKQERIRMEKEMRQRALHEARRSKKEALQHAKMEEAMRKARERELKRQQTVILKQQEKERRKQHLMMIRALESQRKAEERERKKEEKRIEKRMLKQRKMEQRRYERTIARELKKPVDDMVINDGKPLPEFERIKGLNIPGQAYADLLMVEEFVYCFGHVLDIDPETDFPGMADLQAALLNESSNDDALFTACESLLAVALHDPGVSAKTKLGVNLQNLELSEANISEVLRLFILATNENKPHELSDMLTEKSIHSLSPVKKAAILAFLVNELLCSDKIYNEMEHCLEHMSNLRRDKWNMEGRIRKLKADLKAKKTEEGTQKEPDEKATSKPRQKPALKKSNSQDDDASNTSLIKDDQDDEDEEDDDDDEDEEEKDDEDKDSDDEDADDADDDDGGEEGQEEEESEDTDDETEPTTVEEIEKRISRLEKKHSKYRHKLFTASHTLRGLCLGQDRYKRRCHILPHAGGVYMEGMESSELPDEAVAAKEDVQDEIERKRTSSGSGASDINTTPTNESKQFSLELPSPIAVPNNVDKSVFKSPNIRSPVLSPGIKCPSQGNMVPNVFDREHSQVNSSEKPGLLSPSRHSGMVSPPGFIQNSSAKWFTLFPQKACDETSLTRSSIIMPSVNKGRTIVPPNVRLLSQDRHFMDSVSNRPGAMGHLALPGLSPSYQGIPYDPSTSYPFQGKAMHPNHQDNRIHGMPGYIEEMTRSSAPGLPASGIDIQKLIEQDPQKAAVLLDIQSLEPAPVPEDKCYGWWRITDPDMIHKLLKTLNIRGIREKMLHKSLTRHTDYACSSCKKEKEAFSVDNQDEEENKDAEMLKSPKKEKNKGLKPIPPGKIEDKCFPQVAFSVDKDLLMEVEELEEKMFSASLQNKTWRLSQKASSNVSYVKKESKLKTEEKPLELAKARILSLERGIERRYLKPPFRLEKHPNQAQVSKSNGENSQGAEGQPQSSDKDWRITPSLLLWRETVEGCTSSAQLAMCISMLKDCIAWERSIMKVFCIECRKGDNEELLLLCDQCDRGCHTYCCNPKLERIPDGDWFCRECIMIASGSDQCYGCQGSTGRRLKCEFCPRYYHLQCVDPPLQKTPRSPWACPVCKKARLKNKRPPKKKKRPEDEFETLSAFEKYDLPSKSQTSRSKKEKMNNRKQAMKHMAPCRQMLAEMERHECSWPFLVPVNGKQFPEYYQIIKNPMDFHTMKVKLRDFQYESREEFASDARLVFRNCDIFNEDDSEVGQAGKRMLKFFEKRWVYVVSNDVQEKNEDSADLENGSEDSESDGNDSSQIESENEED